MQSPNYIEHYRQ